MPSNCVVYSLLWPTSVSAKKEGAKRNTLQDLSRCLDNLSEMQKSGKRSEMGGLDEGEGGRGGGGGVLFDRWKLLAFYPGATSTLSMGFPLSSNKLESNHYFHVIVTVFF